MTPLLFYFALLPGLWSASGVLIEPPGPDTSGFYACTRNCHDLYPSESTQIEACYFGCRIIYRD